MGKYQMTEVLNFEFTEAEWENIPTCIPKFFTGISKQFNLIERWQQTKDRQETAISVKEYLQKLIDENKYILTQLQTWSESYVESSNERFKTCETTENELEEKLQMFYTKLERDEFTDLNDMIHEPKND